MKILEDIPKVIADCNRTNSVEALIKNNTISNDLKWDASSIDQRFASAFQGLNRSEKK